MIFKDRIEAGDALAQALERLMGADVVIYALPRGGVVVAAQVAEHLKAPLDMIIPRKIGHPLSPEYAIGAVTETGDPIWNNTEIGFTEAAWRDDQVLLARAEAKHRRIKYQGDRPSTDPRGQTVILIDDGIATGLTMIAAVRELKPHKPKKIIVAVPVAAQDTLDRVRRYADEVIALHVPDGYFGAIGAYYVDFPQVGDEEVRGIMSAYRGAPAAEPLDLAALNSVLATTELYPITSAELATRARRLHAPANVVSFFESIPGAVEFRDKADVMRRSEEAEIIMKAKGEEPDESLRSYD